MDSTGFNEYIETVERDRNEALISLEKKRF